MSPTEEHLVSLLRQLINDLLSGRVEADDELRLDEVLHAADAIESLQTRFEVLTAFVHDLVANHALVTPQSPQYQQLSEDAARTRSTVTERDSTINELFATMNRISENLRTVRSKQGQLGAPAEGGETDASTEQRIMDDIASIDGLLAENKTLLERLRKQAKKSASSITALEATVADLERSLSEKDAEIATLKEQLASTNSSLATLIEMYHDKSQLSDMQRTELNTC